VERYDIYLTDALRKEIVGKIQEGKSKPVEKQSGRLSVHDVELDEGKVVRVVYDKKRQQIVTFLYQDPTDYLKPGPGRVAEGKRKPLLSPRQLMRIAKLVPPGCDIDPDLLSPEYFALCVEAPSGIGKTDKIPKTSKRYVEWSSGGKLNRERAEQIQAEWEAWMLGEDVAEESA
jgi:hypothetical protein